MIKNLKVLAKLLVSAGIAAALLVVTGAVAYVAMKGMDTSAKRMYAERTVTITQMAALHNAAWTIRASVLQYIIAPVGERPTERATIAEKEQELQGLIRQYEAGNLTTAEKNGLADFKQAWGDYVQARQNPLNAVDAGDLAKAQQLAYSGIGGQKFSQVMTALNGLIDINKNEARHLSEQISSSGQRSLLLMVLVMAASLGTSLVTSLSIGRGIAKRVGLVADAATRLADGDLTAAELRVDSRDEIGELSRSFNLMQQSLSHLIRSFSASTQSVLAASAELSAASVQTAEVAQGTAQAVGQIAGGAGQSAAAVQQASLLLAQMVGALEAVAAGAGGVAQGADRAAESAKNGAGVVEGTVAGMERIRQVVGETAARIENLEQLSAQIGEITETIARIADQTNLLALNAAIEAARAGEHGRGFAVVAEEVRRLAESSSTSTKAITSLVGNIQSGTAAAVTAMTAGTAEVEAGSRLAAEAGRSLQEILSTVVRAAADVKGIAQAVGKVQTDARDVVQAFDSLAAVTEENTAATEQMAASTAEVTRAIDRIAHISQQNAAATEEVSASTEELTASSEEVSASAQSLAAIAKELQQQVAVFRV